MKPHFFLAACFCCVPLPAWTTRPHQQITQAALDSVPPAVLVRFGTEAVALVEIYSMYPDRFLEMELFSFVRKSEGPKTAEEIRRYCVRPDGVDLHGLTGDRDSDTASLLYLLERVLTMWMEGKPSEAARFAGVLSHYIADSLSPPHAVSVADLRALTPGDDATQAKVLHAVLERSTPAIRLKARAPEAQPASFVAVAESLYERCSVAREQNQRELSELVAAALKKDEPRLDRTRLRAATQAAEILAFALEALQRFAITAN